MVVLVLVGVISIGGGLALWLAGGEPGVSSTTTDASTSVRTACGKTCAAASGNTGTTSAGTTTAASSSAQHTTSEQTVTTDPGDASTRSDTLTVTLLGLGATLALLGMLFPRISKIGLPGGGSIELSAERVGQAAAEAAKTPPNAVETPEGARSLIINVLNELTPEGVDAERAFSPRFIDSAAESAAEAAREQQ